MMSVSGVVIGSYTDSETFTYTADGMRATSRATYTSSGLSLTDISPESFYYSASGQMLSMGQTVDEFTGDFVLVAVYTTQTQYIWGLTYVNDLVAREDNSISGNLGVSGSALGEIIYPTHDANYDTLSLTNSGGAVVQRHLYGPYGSQGVFTSAYGSTTDGYNWVIGFQGGMTDPVTGLVHFDARDYNPATGRWMEQDPLGSSYVNGPNLFQFVGSNPASFGDPTGLYLAAFDGTWDRKQNKDAKPGLGNNGNHTIIQQFVDRDHEQTDYHSGVGTGGGWLGAALGGGFGIGSFTMVDDAWDKMQKYYSDKTKWCEPVDIIGYSRGCYCALLLAQKVSEGIPEAGAP
jgi:RHS repeat-associated protein